MIKRQKCILVVLFLLSLSTTMLSQTIYDGKLIVKESGIFNYKLVLNIDSNKKTVSGYSITDEKGKEETKTLVKGTFQPNKNKINISEYEIVSTKAKASDVVFCFIEAELEMKMVENDSALVGKFTGRLFPKKDICGTGGVFVKQPARKKIKKPKVPTQLPKEKIATPAKEEKIEAKSFDIVTSNTVLTWSSDSALVEIWDQGNQDADSVSIFFDGKLLVSNLKLTDTKVKYKVPISKTSEHMVSILAENEGKYTPNTAAMILHDGNKKYQLLCESKINEMKTIKIKR